MTDRINQIIEDKTLLWGLIFLLGSTVAFLLTKHIDAGTSDFFGKTFLLNYGLTVLFLIMLFTHNKKTYGKLFSFKNLSHGIVLLQLFNISAYSLNRTISIFNISTEWLVWFLAISNLLMTLHVLFQNQNNKWYNHVLVLIFNFGLILNIYETFYLTTIYPFGFVASFFFGISLHIFIPSLFVYSYIKILKPFLKRSFQFWTTTLIAWFIALLLIGISSYRFHQINNVISDNYHRSLEILSHNDLPKWVKVSQNLSQDWFTERALKSGFIFTDRNNLMGGIDRIGMTDQKEHDPIMVVASIIGGEIDLNPSDRINILKYMFDERHSTEEKFWTGINLSTSDIVTNVQIFPSYRMAYTEKTLKIKNTRSKRFGSRQEALYSFYLPEGSVVSSASLWINDKEEPAYLTTKEKANKAYTAIVGRERRDPLLIHWQEGNRVTVRVFPCTPSKDRQFKIGITSPLKKDGDQLTYHNIDFEGPNFKHAKESINVITEGALNDLSSPLSFKEKGSNLHYSGPYKSNWKLQFEAGELSTEVFSFNDKTFSLKELIPQTGKFDPSNIYLDINKDWTKKEFNQIWESVKGKDLLVYCNHKIQKLTEENRLKLFKELRQKNYNLFPFYQMQRVAFSLVITKGGQLTPNLADLKSSDFYKRTSDFFKEHPKQVRVFQIGDQITPYIKTLQEYRSIFLVNGNINELEDFLINKTFAYAQEDARTITNEHGGFNISQVDIETTGSSSAPDHLMRIFTYNEILKAVGKDFFNDTKLQNEWIDEAKEAYVVSPISSLVVLETQADYDRFDIKKSENSLQNASFSNSGSVPEPHEWLLIILVAIFTCYFYFKPSV